MNVRPARWLQTPETIAPLSDDPAVSLPAIASLGRLGNKPPYDNAGQSQVARGFLNWTTDDLAHRAKIGVGTVRKFENGAHTMHKNNMLAVIRAFEEVGVIFTEPTKTRGPGVRLKS